MKMTVVWAGTVFSQRVWLLSACRHLLAATSSLPQTILNVCLSCLSKQLISMNRITMFVCTTSFEQTMLRSSLLEFKLL